MLLNNQWVNGELKEEIKKHLENSENRNTTIQNLWNAVKAVLEGKFVITEIYLKKQEKSQINNVTLHLKELEKEQSPKLVEGRK